MSTAPRLPRELRHNDPCPQCGIPIKGSHRGSSSWGGTVNEPWHHYVADPEIQLLPCGCRFEVD